MTKVHPLEASAAQLLEAMLKIEQEVCVSACLLLPFALISPDCYV